MFHFIICSWVCYCRVRIQCTFKFHPDGSVIMLSDISKLVCTIMNLPWSMAKEPGHRITYKWCFVGRDDWRNVYCDHAPKTPEMSNFLHFVKRFVDIVADMHFSAAYYDTQETHHSILLSHHNWLHSHRLLLASVLPHWSLSICLCWPAIIYAYSVHLWCSPGISPGASALFYSSRATFLK